MPIHFECPDCGYDSDEAGFLLREKPLNVPICVLCAGDSGRDVYLRLREATEDEIASIKVLR